VGGGQIVRGGESLLVHGVGLTTNVEEIGNIVITSARRRAGAGARRGRP
jgi:Cu/Ag efflux pump CusA